MSLSTGHRMMVPLNTLPVCPLTEDLHTSNEGYVTAKYAHGRAKQRCKAWYLGTWNVQSLVDNEGSIETARLSSEPAEPEDRRIDLVIKELCKYNIKVAALQETKWFGKAVYNVGESVVLAAGREVPQGDQPRLRGEGVAIVLTGNAIAEWRVGGEQWKSWGSRIIKATLGSGNRNTSHIHILSCYAPTYGSARSEKENFFDDLQQALDEIPSQELYIVLGDFNARVGARNHMDEDQWQGSRGPHGIGEVNDAGKELLSFLSLNEATTCNTWFQKKEIYKGTWQHPKTKRWHCIDYAIMRATDRRRCLDISVKRGAECNTDHRLLCMKLRMSKLHQIVKTTPSPQRFEVSKLSGPSLNNDGENTSRGQFQELANKIVKEQWKVHGWIN